MVDGLRVSAERMFTVKEVSYYCARVSLPALCFPTGFIVAILNKCNPFWVLIKRLNKSNVCNIYIYLYIYTSRSHLCFSLRVLYHCDVFTFLGVNASRRGSLS